MAQKTYKLLILLVILSMALPFSVFAQKLAAPDATIAFTILHTNDFHGQLQASGSNPGLARVATTVNDVRTAKGTANVLLVDGGDEMQGSLLSNLQKGAPTIAAFNAAGYSVATFGNHEFDWGQTNLTDRTTQATYPSVSANIVVKDAATCDASGWTSPSFTKPYEVKEVGTDPNKVKVAFIGVSTTETPTITVSTATEGLCFKDPYASILHYYDAMKANADVIVVLSHLGLEDGGYGYGIPVYGDKSLATKMINDGKLVNMIIGGHSHTNMAAAFVQTVTGKTGSIPIAQAYYNGRAVGQADFVYDPATKATTVTWQKLAVSTTAVENPAVKAVIDTYANDADYLALVNKPIGYSAVDLPRNGGSVDNMMGTFVDDAIYNYLNSDSVATNDIDIFFNNAGGIRTDWCYNGTAWVNTGCAAALHAPALLTYGNMFTILPFGNATIVGDMTGAQILEVLNHGPQMAGSAVIQPAGLKFKYYAYRDANPGPQPYAWGAFDYCVVNKTTKACDPLDMNKTYKVGTNEFLAPAGGDGYGGFKYMTPTSITYWGDMLDAVDAWVTAQYGIPETAYKGPNGDGTLDGRITRDGSDAPDSGSIIPISILHHNDSHGNLMKGTYVGYTQLATLIKQERLHNPNRTLLFNLGDSIQGDAMMYYFKNAGMGTAADGTALPDALKIDPFIAVMNSMNYTGMVLGNHEFNFGAPVFDSTFRQANFPIMGANLADSGAYGINKINDFGVSTAEADAAKVNVHDGLSVTLPSGKADLPTPIHLGFLGLTNHRVPNYELPSNIPGLTFSNPIDTAAALVPTIRASEDAVVALTHIGFTNNPKDVNVDNNVDTYLAAQVPGIDAIIGSHSHTDPSKQTDYSGAYKYLPTIVGSPDKAPVLVTQAYRYNNYLGEVILGMRAKADGGYEVASETGQYIAVTMATAEDAATKAIIDPYKTIIDKYTDTALGKTEVPIDTLKAYTDETNGANLQADASVWTLEQNGITPDFHLSGAMSNTKIANTATPAVPYSLKISDMFSAMPYENSLVVLKMNGPQIKAVLERSYRNYYYYKYFSKETPKYGGYSYYTTCLLDTNANNTITYNDKNPALPDGNNVVSFKVGDTLIDFTDATKYYNVSTVNYLAAGSCNFNDKDVSLWPLDPPSIVADTQFYVRDAVINYVKAQTAAIHPEIEGRIQFSNLTPGLTYTADKSSKSGLPTAAVPYTLTLANAGNATKYHFTASDIAPWQVVLPPDTAVASNSSVDVTLLVKVSADAAFNDSKVLKVTATATGGTPTKDLDLTTTVLEAHSALLTPDSASKNAKAGDAVKYSVVVKNTGNNTESVTLAVTGSTWAVIDAPTFDLAPSAVKTVVVTVTVPKDAPSAANEATVTASSHAGVSNLGSVKLTTTVNWLSFYFPSIFQAAK
jgi:2',3'-cyclic-nucleotide 2'-phosphodiesterase (5'-nucleotidase family)